MMINLIKLLFAGNGQQQAEELIKLAFAEGKINSQDLELINEEIDGFQFSRSDLELNDSDMNRLKHSLPSDKCKKFKVIYLLVTKFMKNHKLEEERFSVLTQIVSLLQHERSRVQELIRSLVSNITSGNSMSDSFKRLEYLLEPRQVNFN